MGNEHSKTKEINQNGTVPEKHENGSVNGISPKITSNGLDTEAHQKSEEPLTLSQSTEPDFVVIESACQPAEAPVISELPEPVATLAEEVKKTKDEKGSFGRFFKKKHDRLAEAESVEEKKTTGADQTDVSAAGAAQQPEADNLKQESESLTEPESVTPDPSPVEEKAPETEAADTEPAENQEEDKPEENPVMNFFKTLVGPTKTSKKETSTPDAAKVQSQTEAEPAAPTTAAQVSEPPAAPKGMSIPPPPPPEPPKMEVKGEPAAKPVKAPVKEEPKAAAKEPEASKGKSAKDTLRKLFRPKVQLSVTSSKGKGASPSGASAPGKTSAPATIKETPVEVEVQPVVESQETPAAEAAAPLVELQSENKIEAQEAAGKEEEKEKEKEKEEQPVVEEQMVNGASQQDEKVDPSKTGTLEAAAKPEPPPPVQEEKKPATKSSFLAFFKPKDAEPKMAASGAAAAAGAGEAGQAAKTKDEPKATAKSSEANVDNKQAASQAADDAIAASVPKKLEKRNSIQLFFKNLGQKRHSTDAGVQTEPVVAAAAEKAK